MYHVHDQCTQHPNIQTHGWMLERNRDRRLYIVSVCVCVCTTPKRATALHEFKVEFMYSTERFGST